MPSARKTAGCHHKNRLPRVELGRPLCGDAFKERIDVDVASDRFPDAVVCGDDWNWKNSVGEMQMQENVLGVAKERGLSVVADRATWILYADTPKQK